MYSTVTEEGQTPRTQITNTSRRWTTCSDQPGDLNVPVHARVFQKKDKSTQDISVSTDWA